MSEAGDGLSSPVCKKRAESSSWGLSPQDLSRYDRAFPNFRKPRVIGHFSLDCNRKIHFDCHQMKFYIPPKDASKVHYDLHQGVGKAVRKAEEVSKEEKINHILSWILKNKDKFHVPQMQPQDTEQHTKLKSLSTDFICFRGLLTTVLCTPYETRDGWIINATKFQGTIYLCQQDTEEKLRQLAEQTEKHREMCSWGYKFEQYLLAESPDTSPQTDEPVNESEEFCCLFRTRLAAHSLVYGAEMDGVQSGGKAVEKGKDGNQSCHETTETVKDSINLETVSFVELKTNREIENERQDRNFKRFKLIKWWAQCFLVGIDCVVCGFRNDSGVVNKLSTFKVSEIPKLAKGFGRGVWNANVCMNFCEEFLSFVKQMIVVDDPQSVYRFEWRPKGDVMMTYLGKDSRWQILPDWYIREVFR